MSHPYVRRNEILGRADSYCSICDNSYGSIIKLKLHMANNPSYVKSVVRTLPGVTTWTNIAEFTQGRNHSLVTDVDVAFLHGTSDALCVTSAIRGRRFIFSTSMSRNSTLSIWRVVRISNNSRFLLSLDLISLSGISYFLVCPVP